MQVPRLIALDLDGTLLPQSKELTPRTIDALARMQDLGARITLATGKFLHLTRRYGRTLGLSTPLIALDGARIGTLEETVVEHGFGRETAEQILDAYAPLELDVFADDGRDGLLLRSRRADLVRAIRPWADDVRVVDDIRDHLVGSPGILSFYGPPDVVARMADEVRGRHPHLRASVFEISWLRVSRVTFQPAGISKGSGLSHLMEDCGISPEDCLVFGDWHNDLPMFEVGCVSVAMRNAVPELAAVAHHHTEHDNENDGVARFLEERFLSGTTVARGC